MNANELADGLSKNQIHGDDHGLFNRRIQNMLRQQQAEIEALKDRNWDLVSEPWGFDRHEAKTLTDEEILEVAKEMGWRGALGFLIRFARAILRKAQEK